MPIDLRKLLLNVETTYVEEGRGVAVPLRMIAAMAIVRNPWAGRRFVENPKPEIDEIAPVLGQLLTQMIIETVGAKSYVASVGGRPHHRIGDRYQDLKDLGHDVCNPSAV